MQVLETAIDIDASPERVWEVLLDFPRYPEWNPFITSIAGPAVAGAELAVTLAPPEGRAITMHPEVQVVDERHRFAWLGRLGVPYVFDGAHEFLVEPGSDGHVRFVQRETFRGVLVPFLRRVLARTRRGFEAMNRALKDRAEGTAS
jgi:hypothetical protein